VRGPAEKPLREPADRLDAPVIAAGKRRASRRPFWQILQIVAWADAHRERTGEWPQTDSGFIPESPGDRWANLDAALRMGLRGLPSGWSLARLLAHDRGSAGAPALPCNTSVQVRAEEVLLPYALPGVTLRHTERRTR